ITSFSENDDGSNRLPGASIMSFRGMDNFIRYPREFSSIGSLRGHYSPGPINRLELFQHFSCFSMTLLTL
ncbi:MAG TPA: hypothetical protein VMW78_10185, partial [Anaerolineae bacterium]|nr:hypothetical protein [Anaerolineae bacterium]